MTEIGRLTEVAPREAWPGEAEHFTPWLAAHLGELGQVLGLELEAVGSEAPVENFRADVLARDVTGEALVLIENQLERSDHRHLGQIMTYLAGLGARVVVWIATDFHEPHLAAIKWLNEHTVEPYAFFAVKLRVVRIGDSPLAPIFDVVERPNTWERRTQAAVRRSTGEVSEEGRSYREFWNAYLERYPEDEALGFKPTASYTCWLRVGLEPELVVSVNKAKKQMIIFLRGPTGSDLAEVEARIEPHAGALAAAGIPARVITLDIDTTDRERWPECFDWMHAKAHAYVTTLRDLLKDDAA